VPNGEAGSEDEGEKYDNGGGGGSGDGAQVGLQPGTHWSILGKKV